MRVLWVEDDAPLAPGFKFRLNDLDVASTVRRACELLSANTYNAIILDLLLPEDLGHRSLERFPGIALARRIREGDKAGGFNLERNKSAKIVIFSMAARKSFEDDLDELDIKFYNKRQISFVDLIDVVRSEAS